MTDESKLVEYEYKLLAGNEAVRNKRREMLACGYSGEDLDLLPPGAVMGISCGSPTSHCNLQPGMKTLDIGCGPGSDVLLSAHRVAPGGRAVGLDLVQEMVERARHNAAQCGWLDLAAVEFSQRDVNRDPLWSHDDAFDRVTSNCCIDFLDRPRIFAEALRVLQPGGRLVFSDVLVKQPLPRELRKLLLACCETVVSTADDSIGGKCFRTLISCVQRNALHLPEVEAQLGGCGFEPVSVVTRSPVPGTPEHPDLARVLPPMTSVVTPPEQVRALEQRLAPVFGSVDVNHYAEFATIIAHAPPG